MKKTSLPRRRYGMDDYPNLNPDAIGRVIPIAYGEFENLQPTEIDTTARTWKIVDQAVAEITRIASATKDPLIEGLDYTEDLAKAEFTLLFNERIDWIPANYWFSVEADYAVSDVNYFGMDRNESVYTDGLNYLIDSGDGWTSTADGRDILFHVLGKTSYESSEVTLASNLTGGDPGIEIGLKDDVSRTKIGQSFRSAYAAYVTKIIVYGVIHGNLSGKKLQCTVWSDVGITQVGNKTEWTIVDTTTQMPVTESNENEELECDILAPDPEMNQVADILPDVIENVMGKNPAILDATHLANLATDRVQPLEIFLREEIEFGDFVAKLEAGQLWKLIPKQDATYMTVVFEDGEPGNTPHFRDHDFLSFEMEHSVVDMRHIVNAFYAEDPTIGDYSAVQKTSDVARFFYMNEQSMDVETYLRDLADAEALASAYLARYEVPVITATFEVHGWALDLLPGRDKVKLTRARAPYGGNAWPWKRRVKLPPPGENLTDFPVQAPIVADAHIGSWARPDGHDIRFTDLDGNELPYERESFAVADVGIPSNEVLVDGGLEDWISATNLTSWTETLYGTSTVNRDGADKHGGNYSVRLDIDAGNQAALIKQSLALVPGATYLLSFWYKTEAGKTAYAALRNDAENVYLKADGTWEGLNGGSGIVLPAATAWTYYEVEFAAHASYTDYYLQLQNYSAASSSIRFDDVSIKDYSDTEKQATAIFWVKKNVSTAGTYIWCYYGNADATDGENAEAVWDANFKAVYHMKDATTSTILDSTENNNHGTKKGANEPIEADGKIGKGQDFDGANDAINCGHDTSLDGASLTAEAWVSASSLGGIFGRHQWEAQQHGWWASRDINGNYTFLVGDGTEHFAIGAPGVPTAEEHIVFTWSAGTLTIYKNGILANSAGGHAYTPVVGLDIRISYNDVGWFDGILDEVRISSIARSAEWIAYDFANQDPADGGLTWGNPERTGGSLDGVLFRIVKLIKKPESNIVEVTACIWGQAAV